MTLAALVAFVAVYSAGAYSGLLEGAALVLWSDIAWTISPLAAGLKCLHTAHAQTRRNERRAWYTFGVAALLWFVGMLVWDYLELVEGIIVPYPSAADAFYTGFALTFVVGILFYRDTRSPRYVNYIQFGNLGIIICTVIIITSTILYPQIAQSEESILFIGMSISYAVVFMSAFIFGLFSYWFYAWTTSRKAFPLILTALFIHAVADTLYAFELFGKSFGAGSYLSVFWIVAFAVQYWAAVEQDSARTAPESDPDTTPKLNELQNLEAIAPSVSLLSIMLTVWLFGRDIDFAFLEFILAVSFVLMVFLVIREWSMGRSLTFARNNLEQQIQERTQQLTQANRELEAYSYSIAHDLRSPLRAVTGFSQILLADAYDKLDEDERNSLERISKAGNYMARLIDEILELSRVTRVEMQNEAVDISALSERIATRLAESEPERVVAWHIRPRIKVEGDPKLLAQVMENLLGNAFKYTSTTSHARIEVGIKHAKGEMILFVRDNGVGFDMGFYDKLFEPFHRLHSPEEFPGSGVGLATVQRIIERHGGRIWAEAKPGEGATFYLSLPSKQ